MNEIPLCSFHEAPAAGLLSRMVHAYDGNYAVALCEACLAKLPPPAGELYVGGEIVSKSARERELEHEKRS